MVLTTTFAASEARHLRHQSLPRKMWDLVRLSQVTSMQRSFQIPLVTHAADLVGSTSSPGGW